MTTLEFLAELKRAGIGIQLSAEGQLRVQARKGAMTAAIRAELKARKAEIVSLLRQTEQARGEAKGSIERAPRDRPAPLSFAQERLWFLDRLDPESAAYNLPLSRRFDGPLDESVLRRALEALCRRHEALRTRFPEDEAGRPLQVIEARAPLDYALETLEGAAETRWPACQARIDAEAARPFDLAAGPLFRARLYRVEPQAHALLLVFHHIVFDGWSANILLEELHALYDGFAAGADPVPGFEEPPPLQPADFASWQRDWLSGETLARQYAYWERRLEGAPGHMEFPEDFKRPDRLSDRGDVVRVPAKPGVATTLDALCREEDATPFMATAAAFAVALARYSGQTDLCVGTPIAGRNHPQVQHMIGFFVNTLTLRFDLSGAPSFRELLRRARAVTREAFDHQDLPFEKIVERLRLARDANRTPLFQAMFSLEALDAGGEGPEWTGGLRASLLAADTPVVKFDITATMVKLGEDLQGAISFRTDLYTPESMARFAAGYARLLDGLAASPDRCVFDAPMLAEDDRRLILESFNDTRSEYPRDTPVHLLFEAWAARTPSAPAVKTADGELSYDELNRRANRLAHWLRARGARPGNRVGFFLERGVDAVTAMLAILKTGAAYAPLDPRHPRERLAFMAADTGMNLLLVHERFRQAAPEGPSVHVFETLDGALAGQPERNPGVFADPLSLAYIMYTSGSTGQPKGVMAVHRAVVRLVINTTYIELGPGDGLLQIAPLAFDASTFEIWGPLLNGAWLAVADSDALDQLPAALARFSMVNLWVTTQLFHVLVDDYPEAIRPLRHMMTGGETMSLEHARRFLEDYPDCRFTHFYGPTENTTFTTTCALGDHGLTPFSAPIGAPIANTTVYLVDRRMNLTPPGVAGLLLTGGDGLARGYHDRPDLTAERFIPNPFATEPGQRLYDSGDLARWLPNGQIDFIGRADRQVKIRGFRIEPAEIEHAMRAHPQVRDAVVLVLEKAGGAQLAGYLAAEEAAGADDALKQDVARFLETRLPAYMVPKYMVAMDRFPVNPNGKVDRRKLPDPEEAAGAELFRPPRTPTQELLAGIWAELLRRKRVGLDDNFFEAGGHSLMAIQIIARVRDLFDIHVPVRDLFENPRLESFAARIDELARGDVADAAPPIEPAPRDRPTPLTFAQERLWFIDRLDPESDAYNMPIAWRLDGVPDPNALRRAFDALVRRHESLRVHFEENENGDPIQVAGPSAPADFEILEPAQCGDEDRARQLMAAEGARPFSLTRGPLMRVRLYRIDDRRAFLLWNMHHIISDGWSIGLMARELATLYDAFAAGRPDPLPPPALQYIDYACWQRRWFRGERLENLLGHWRERLHGAAHALDFPTDRPRPAMQTFGGASCPFHIDQTAAEALTALCRNERATLFMGLLAVYGALLGRYARQADFCVGAPVAGRVRRETEPMVGFFVNMLALRIRLTDDPAFIELLRRARETTLDAYANQDASFEQIVERLQPERDPSRSPLFQHTISLDTLDLDGLAALRLGEDLIMESADSGAGGVKFDFYFTFARDDDGLHGCIHYNTDLFEAASMTRLAKHFTAFLTNAAAWPDRPVSAVPILDEGENRQLLETFNQSASDYPRESSIHALFEHWARTTPEAPALNSESGRLGYGELNARAAAVAEALRARGVGAEDRIGFLLTLSHDAIVVMLGILKTGAAYVPLDGDNPLERNRFIVRDTGMKLLIVQRDERDAAASLEAGGPPILTLEDLAPQPDAADHAGSAAPPLALAYVMYTSGSTGAPKGVAIAHRGVVRLVKKNWFMRFSADERYLAIAPLAFDASTLEIWGALLNGAPLTVSPTDSIDHLPRTLARFKITKLHLTAQLFHMAVDENPESLSGLKRLLAGGDRLSDAHVSKFLELYPDIEFNNCYGPTENTTFTTTCKLREHGLTPFSVPIGQPVSNTRVYILDEWQRPAPPMVGGRLFTSGDGLARGYFGRPDLTAEKFIPCPHEEAGARMYDTGDLARWLPGGVIEFLGRADRQVKVRGYRIELTEIEHALREHPRARDAVALMRERGGDKRLVGYVLIDGDTGDAASLNRDVKTFLEGRLPPYMVPSALVPMTDFPVTHNGKVDRAALPDPNEAFTGAAYEPPRTDSEQVLAEIWAALLDRGDARVGRADNFFELGGHSLLGLKILSRVRKAFGSAPPMRALFENPRLAAFAAQIDAIRGQADAADIPPLAPAPADTRAFPLSYAQERLWFLDQLEPGGSVYNMPLAFTLRGRADGAGLHAALDALTRRQAVLRTRFIAAPEGAPAQIIDPPAAAFSWVDLSGAPAAARQALASSLVAQTANAPFDLAAGPLFRAAYFHLKPQSGILTLNMHHIIADGWSLGILLGDLTALYREVVQPRPAGDSQAALGSEPAIQYADYAYWQRGWLRGEALEAKLRYWEDALADAPAALDLPLDHPRPPRQTYRGGDVAVSLDAAAAEALQSLCRDHGASPFMGLLAAFAALLDRYSGQRDICIGTPVANRDHKELENLIGFFVNTLALRVDVSGDPGFGELLERARRATLDGFAHQDAPFEQVVDRLRPQRDLSRPPLFQAMFSLENVGVSQTLGTLSAPGFELEPAASGFSGAKFELHLALGETDDGFSGTLNYNADLFAPETAARLAGHFSRLLASALAQPDAPLSQLDFFEKAERRLILETWNAHERAYPADMTLTDMFTAQARRTPQRTAIHCGGRTVDYAELARRAGALARLLRARGAGPETYVGVCLNRDEALIVALLATLETGAAYVPLDPAYPAERIAFTLEDAQTPLLITRADASANLDASSAEIIDLECVDLSTPDSAAVASDHWRAGSAAAAYALFTSGSTGRPKGVAISHRSVAAMLAWARRVYRPDQWACTLAATSVCFDLSVFEMFLPLTSGGAVAMVFNAMGLPEVDAPVTLINTVPSAIAELLRMEAIPETARTINLAGEPLRRDLVQRLYALDHVDQVYNLYGPSEDTTYSTWALIPRDEAREPTIGAPLDNSRVYLLNESLRPVPLGCPGELCLAGAGLARGYLNRPALTAAKFIANPFATDGSRLYRTGDLARWLPDGRLAFLGRLDHQVKLRGFRIELGEIETALRACDSVRDAAVLAREDQPGEQSLTAYVAGGGDADALRAHLAERVPHFMIPAHFVFLDSLPLTPNGKLDRKALPAPDLGEDRGFVAPRDELERAMAAIWAEVLGVDDAERIGAEADFFALGGHSLLAARVAARVRERFEVDLPVRALFERPTPAALAREVARAMTAGAVVDEPPLAPAGRDAVPLSFPQERLWFIYKLDPEGSAYNVPLAMRAKGRLDETAFQRALDALVDRHESLRTRFEERDGDAFQIIDAPAPAAFTAVDLRPDPPQEREPAFRRALQAETEQPFDLRRGPLFRVHAWRLDDDDWGLLLNMHHIVSDGWSIEVLARDLTALYRRALAEDEALDLEPLPIQYADYAHWQRRRLQGEPLERLLAYWEESLRGAPPDLELPTDRPRPPIQSFHGGHCRFELGPAVAHALDAACREQGVTPFMAALAIYATLLARHANQDEVCIGAAIANRGRTALDGLIGFFVNTLALRVDLRGDPSFIELLRRTRHMALNGFANQEAPLELVIDRLNLDRDPSRPPLFQAAFAYETLAADRPQEDLPGVAFTAEPFEYPVSKFEITLGLTRQDETLHGVIEYAADLFDADTITRLGERFAVLAASLTERPERPVGQASIMTDAERGRALDEWNDTASPFPRDKLLHELFEDCARARPADPAVYWEGDTLSYGELDARANQLARRLTALGVRPDVSVGVCVAKDLMLPAALLGILKAGGAYTPLDPTYPADRIVRMIEDAGVALALVTEGAAEWRVEGLRVFDLASDWPEAAALPADKPTVSVDPQNLAFTLFTSGTTGRPKGVMLTHRGAVNFVNTDPEWHARPGDHVAQMSNLSFDAFTYELWTALSHGACVNLVPRETLFDLDALEAWFVERRIAAGLAATAVFNHLGHERPAIFRTARVFHFGGEQADLQSVRAVLEHSRVPLLHGYGPTEATTYVTIERVTELAEEAEVLPIGSPIANTRVYLVDRQLQPVPVGVIGSLLIAGVGLARGYRNRPAHTAASFIPDPFSREPGGRLYLTGDLALWLADGRLVFKGRRDHQVKLRGHRIELREIEIALGDHADIGECTVLLREDGANPVIVAYASKRPESAAAPDADGLRTHLETRLPPYMIPAFFVILDRLPLTANGKVDRDALPAPDADSEKSETPPQTNTQKLIKAIWSEVLDVASFGIHDNFFALGGHSLTISKVHAKLQDALARPVALVKLFEHPTIATLARYLEDGGIPAAEDERVKQRASSRKQALRRRRKHRRD